MFKSQEQLIAEIHNEFDTAQDRLLDQANDLLKSLEIPTETRIEEVADRLTKVGFINTPTVQQASKLKEVRRKIEETVVYTREQAELIQYYKFSYPFLKFLTEDELNRICEKYNLIHAPVASYTKEVPEKNLRDIEQAQNLRSEDVFGDKLYFRSNFQAGLDEGFKALGLINGEITIADVKALIFNSRYHKSKNMCEYYYDDFLKTGSNTWLFCIQTNEKLSGYESWMYDGIEHISKSGLFIAAPESHFNLNGLDKKSKYGFFQVFKTEVKDPIVFRYVRGGVQVLTKWGLEGEDPALVVEKFN